MVPDEACEGDAVVIFAGAKVPHVLRPVGKALRVKKRAQSARNFSLVGDCYLHGLMNGETFPRVGRTEWEDLILF
jgi:hypothetical protein